MSYPDSSPPYLVSHYWLLDRGKILKGREQDMTPLRATDVFDKIAQLLAQCHKYFVFVLDRF